MDQSFSLIFIAAMIGIVYFLMIRPQNQQRKKHEEMVASLANGDQVVIQSGIHGIVKHVDDDTVKIEISEGVVIVQQRAMVMSITQKAPEKRSASKKSTSKKGTVKKTTAKPARRTKASKSAE